MYPEGGSPYDPPIDPTEQRALGMMYPGYDAEELNFMQEINKSEFLPDVAKTRLFGLFDRLVVMTNYDVHQIKEERARCDELLAWIRFNMPPGRYTSEVGVLLRNIKMMHNAVLAGAYKGFRRTQMNTKFAHVTTERNTPEPEKPGLRKKLLGF